jgi:predicted transcriptional regulator
VADNAADDTYDEAWQGAEPVAGDEASTQASAQSHSSQGASASASAQAAGHEAGASASSSDGVTATVPRATGGSSGSYSPSPYGPDGEEAVDQTDGKRASYSMYAGGSGPSSAQSAQVAPISAEAMAVAIATTVALGGAAATAGFFFIPGWRTAATRVLRATPLAFLFSRIDKDEVLEHPTRSELFESIRQAPGERVEDVRRQLGLANGTMLHHLRVLCDKDLVRRVKQGGITRLYPAGPRITPKPYLIPQRRMVLGAVAATPGLQQRQVATCVGMSERMVSYHIRQLVADDLIQVRRIGGANYCYPAKDPAELPALVQPAPSCAIASRP